MLEEQKLKRLISLLSKFTKIPLSELNSFINEDNDIVNFLKRPQSFTTDPAKIRKIEDIEALRVLLKVGFDTEKRSISDPQSVYNHFSEYAAKVDKEYTLAAFLDRGLGIIKSEVLSVGTDGRSLVNVRDIAKKAIGYDCSRVILAHNHPAGSLKPSSDDMHVTTRLHSALRLLSIDLVDHIILGEKGFYSMNEHGHFNDLKPLKETLSLNVEEKIVNIYSKEFPAIKYINTSTAEAIENLNSGRNVPHSIKGIKERYKELGYRLEIRNNAAEFKEFNSLSVIVDDLKKAQMTSKIKAHELSEGSQLIKINSIER